MTCIIGLEREGVLWIGGDSAAYREDEVNARADPKVWKSGKFIFGFSGSFRIGQLLRWGFKPPKNNRDSDIEYMVIDFVDAIKSLLEEKGAASKSESGDSFDAEIIVGYKRRLYVIESDFNVSSRTDTYVSSGGGAPYALGAMWVLESQGTLPPDQVIEKALSASAQYCPSVKVPFSIINSK